MTQNSRKVARLHREQDGLCYWCKQSCFLPGKKGHKRPNTGVLGGKAATLDHIYPQYDLIRYARPMGTYLREVMACNTCNNGRNKQFKEKIPRNKRKRFYRWLRDGGVGRTVEAVRAETDGLGN